MRIQCPKCPGRMFVDEMYSEKNHYELFCMTCGHRVTLNKGKSSNGQEKKE